MKHLAISLLGASALIWVALAYAFVVLYGAGCGGATGDTSAQANPIIINCQMYPTLDSLHAAEAAASPDVAARMDEMCDHLFDPTTTVTTTTDTDTNSGNTSDSGNTSEVQP